MWQDVRHDFGQKKLPDHSGSIVIPSKRGGCGKTLTYSPTVLVVQMRGGS